MRRDTEDERSSLTNSDKVETPKGPGSKPLPQEECCDDSSNVCSPVEREKSKAPCNKEKEVSVLHLFQEEIKSQAVSMEIVRRKISANELLKNEDPKRVLDKVRAQWRFATSENAGSPPSAEETLTQKVERSRINVKSSDIVSASRASTTTTEASGIRCIFSPSEIDTLKTAFSDMITKSAPISKPKIQEILQREDWGKQILKKATLDTMVNRVKYERRIARKSKELK